MPSAPVPPTGDALVARAAALAARLHAGQRYGDAPYVDHLAAVVGVLEDHGLTAPELRAAAWLHDAIEDTPATAESLAAAVGPAVAAIADALTDGPGATRAEKKARPYRRIPATPGAVLVKLADRIANLAACAHSQPHKRARYVAEHPAFRAALWSPEAPEAAPLWATLDALVARPA